MARGSACLRVPRASSIETATSAFTSTTTRPVTAHHVVVAAGSWSGHIDIDGDSAAAGETDPRAVAAACVRRPPRSTVSCGDRGAISCRRATGSILVGATVEDAGFDERTTVAGVRDLLDSACDLVPHLWQATFVGARVGLRPATVDEMPIIGRSAKMPGLVYATGHYRNGVLLAPLTARAVADLVLDNRDDPLLTAASPQRFGEY